MSSPLQADLKGVCQPLLGAQHTKGDESREESAQRSLHVSGFDIDGSERAGTCAPYTYPHVAVLLWTRAVQLTLVSGATLILSWGLDDMPDRVHTPRSWAYCLVVGLIFSTFCLLQLTFLVITVANAKKPAASVKPQLPRLLMISSLAFDFFYAFLLFGAAMGIVPDSPGGSYSFEPELKNHHTLWSTLHTSDKQVEERLDILDAYQRVHRSWIAACMFFVSYTNLCSLAYVCYTHFEIKAY